MFGFHTHCYSPLNNDENLDKQIPNSFGGILAGLFKLFVLILALFGVGSLGLVTGRRSVYEQSDFQHNNAPVDNLSRIFAYNGTFAEASEESKEAWKELIPYHGGFFKHPTLAPQKSVFSIFHQLHCLNGIREGYWVLYLAMNEQRVIEDDDMPGMTSPRHFRHCIDLLRQALMCQPDLTLEIKNETIGGVKGFGTEHQCKDWDQLMSFTKKWETWGS